MNEAIMTKNGKSKLKILFLRQILENETDDKHGLTMAQIIERLNDLDIPAERKGLYRDLQTLQEFGVDIQTFPRKPVEYAIVRRDFDLSQLMLMVDAVQSCKFLTKRQAAAITTNLKLLASDYQRELLNRSIHVPGQVSSKNESVFATIDIIHEAMRQKQKLEFKYYRHGLDGKRYPTHNDKPHVVTPVGITFSDGFYYLTAWSDSHETMMEFRVDRMGEVRPSKEPATRNEAIANYSFTQDAFASFGRFGGELTTATLLVNQDKVEIIIDRFGSNAELYPHDKHTAKARVNVQKSEQFFGWIAGLGGTVRIEGPKSLKEEYVAYLQRLIDNELPADH